MSSKFEIEIPFSTSLSTFSESSNLAERFLNNEIDLNWFSGTSEFGENPALETVELSKRVLLRFAALWSSLTRVSANDAGSIILVFKDHTIEIDADLDISIEKVSGNQRIICKFAEINEALLAKFIPAVTTGKEYSLAA